jgi:hypothetical protein
MGCGAVKQIPPDPETVVSDPPPHQSWATKRSPLGKSDNSDNSLVEPATTVITKPDTSCVLQDADDDDEIEIICEAVPKYRNNAAKAQEHYEHYKPAANIFANGQEPPEAAEPIGLQPKPEPLSKQQQEEAAKLAERRRLFDNKRYENAQKSPSDAVTSVTSVRQVPIATNPSVNPTTDMIFGLNLSANRYSHNEVTQQENTFLPGGILDDFEEARPIVHTGNKKKKIKTHDDVESTGFDADDEALMKEILEDFEP